MAQRGFHCTAQSLSCWSGRIQSSCVLLRDSLFFSEPWRGHLCWRGGRLFWGQWMQCTEAGSFLYTSLAFVMKRPCLLLIFQLRNHTMIQGRHVLPTSAGEPGGPEHKPCPQCWVGRALCNCCIYFSRFCSCTGWQVKRLTCPVVRRLIPSTGRGVHAVGIAELSCNSWEGQGGCSKNFSICQAVNGLAELIFCW